MTFNSGVCYAEWTERNGASHIQGAWITTTPNTTWVPRHPSLHRNMRLRIDGYFADDDPCIWPQPIFIGYEHLTCIKRRVVPGTMPIDLFLSPIKLEDIAIITSDSREPLYKTTSTFNALVNHHRNIMTQQSLDFLARTHHTSHRRLRELVVLLEQATSLLEAHIGGKNTIGWSFAIVARTYLELSAYLDYQHRCDNILFAPSSEEPCDTTIMGAFVTTADTARHLFKLGIPIWWIRHKSCPSLLASPLTEHVAETAPDAVKIDVGMCIEHHLAFDPTAPPLFCGDSYQVEFLDHLHSWPGRQIYHTYSTTAIKRHLLYTEPDLSHGRADNNGVYTKPKKRRKRNNLTSEGAGGTRNISSASEGRLYLKSLYSWLTNMGM